MSIRRYHWSARDQQGKLVEGEILGKSSAEVAAQVLKQGFTLLDIKHAEEVLTSTAPSDNPSPTLPPTPLPRWIPALVRPIDLAVLFRSLESSVRAGLPLTRTFDIINRTSTSKRIQSLAVELRDTLIEGHSLTDALGRYTDVVPAFALSILKAGEVSGHIEESLRRLAEHYENEHELMQELRWRIALPKAELGCFLLLIVSLPPLFSWVAGVSSGGFHLSSAILLLLGPAILLFGGGYIYQLLQYTKPVAALTDWIKFNLPGLAGLTRRLALARFLSILSLCIESGFPYWEGAELAIPAIGNLSLQSLLRSTLPRLRQGAKLTEVLQPLGILPMQAMQMIYTGEDTGDLDKLLLITAVELRQQGQADVRVLIITLSIVLLTLVVILMGTAILFSAL